MATISTSFCQGFLQLAETFRASYTDISSTDPGNSLFTQNFEKLYQLRGAMRELEENGHELFRELVSRVHVNNGIGETVHEIRGSPVSDLLNSFIVNARGRDRDVSISAFDYRLDRFKVKTVTIGIVTQK